jgi:hypothetical protein
VTIQPADSLRVVVFDPITGLPGIFLTAPTSRVAISTATTTLVKTGAGRLNSITVNSLGTVASTVTVYDAVTATGTPIAVINSLTLSGAFVYNVPFTTGLTIVTTGSVAPNLTVAYS